MECPTGRANDPGAPEPGTKGAYRSGEREKEKQNMSACCSCDVFQVSMALRNNVAPVQEAAEDILT